MKFEGFLADADFSRGEVGTVDFALFAESGQELDRLHRVPPLVVAASNNQVLKNILFYEQISWFLKFGKSTFRFLGEIPRGSLFLFPFFPS